ncbi:hypothetical protein AMECASPLE_021952 [Ameca splendens]|uniref:Uncharacterized protein n=1 Tax=Ameca splendens TaxID=208324 RepID=A0ABV0ZPU7_9TELE
MWTSFSSLIREQGSAMTLRTRCKRTDVSVGPFESQNAFESECRCAQVSARLVSHLNGLFWLCLLSQPGLSCGCVTLSFLLIVLPLSLPAPLAASLASTFTPELKVKTHPSIGNRPSKKILKNGFNLDGMK